MSLQNLYFPTIIALAVRITNLSFYLEFMYLFKTMGKMIDNSYLFVRPLLIYEDYNIITGYMVLFMLILL